MHVRHSQSRTALAASLTAALLLAACFAPTELPRGTGVISGETPALLPLSQIVERAAETPNTARLSAEPEPRVAALQARAAQLRAPIIPAQERKRMLAAPDRLR